MDVKTKIILIAAVLLIFGLLGFIVYNQYEISKRQEAIQTQITQMKLLPDGTQRAETHWATKEDLEALGKQNSVDMKAVQDDLKTLHASLTAVNVVTTSSSAQFSTNVSATSTTPNPNPNNSISTSDSFGYMKNRQVLHLDENFNGTKVPIGDVGFSAWQEKPFDLNLNAREYKLTTVLGTDENSKQYAYNKFVIKVGDKEYPVKIANNTFSQEYPEAKFRFSPRLYLGVAGGLNVNQMRGEAFPDIGVGLFSYGRTKDNPDLNFAQIGIGYGMDSHKPIISITPIGYNIGQHVPLMKSLEVAPVLGISTDGSLIPSVGLRLGM